MIRRIDDLMCKLWKRQVRRKKMRRIYLKKEYVVSRQYKEYAERMLEERIRGENAWENV